MSMNDEQNVECPLCMEPLELDDINFFPCTCGYQICRFCWHRIRTDENGLCPACRKQYPEDPADFKPLTQEEIQRIKNEKRQKDMQRKQKISENRKHLGNVRVVQKNLVFVVGLSQRLADHEVLKRHEYFGKFGKIHKVVINHSTSYAGSQGPSASAYVTYFRVEDALRAIQAVNNIHVDGRSLKVSLGTTKYCSHFLKSQQCPKPECMYLHELGDDAASFTKEEKYRIASMEALSHLVKVTLPGYLSSLPVPESVGAIFSLPVRDWIRLLPFAGTVTFFAWTAYTKFLPDKKGQTVNKCIMKSSSKVVHSFDIEDLGSKVSFCRCWRSKKFPYCDGSHNAHNEEHCDNVGPLVLKKKDA